ncbi:Rrf2 family transcriptional regulator [Polynucleobacter paneuropaeus]|uniref:Rrf2 family transcriptional regulator n=1 Tax=Polynucleobacter paneuropaeus TaxID=2527775 RepID=A0AAE2YKE6_9BURK|nr:Rrf2 family transcriptional regulator [Polynucleobacter sp. JS-Fieb-80-E5]MBT8589488.1 Rrf2 family transcriptional regulator [Polynucleobacter paneuropaeus]MBT8591141.1 Rrf2 family transcriptional regulator [Polynucleobacter paneuropaeus]MBT8596531.1 Rrf2 family transcriptional regulator [Polynucleobacter paneuropaeus]MBT8598344.1 Rrf2 family transcriptional regulator [Polynucleobacter paneuropaeus]MBU3618159.1 Rrf2 family transcriptional regulator [Polynucleobacter sp. JS-Fieb-80-E5]
MLKYINRSLEQTINTLIDITAYSRFGVPVRAIDIAKRQHLSLSRMEIVLSALKSAYLIRAAKGRRGGYYLAKDPQSMTMKDVFLAVNHFRSRKVVIADFAKEIVESFESYMRDCLSKIAVASSSKHARTRPFQIEIIPAWDSQKYQLQEISKKGKWDTQSVLITKAGLQKAEKLGPNSIFDFSNYLQ